MCIYIYFGKDISLYVCVVAYEMTMVKGLSLVLRPEGAHSSCLTKHPSGGGEQVI